MTQEKSNTTNWGRGVVILSLLLFLFTIPHTLEDFATGEPARAGIPAPLISYVIAGLVALQALALFWAGRQLRRSYFIHAFLGVFWPLAAGGAQLPAILAQGPYRAGFISVFHVGGMIGTGVLLLVVSILAIRADRLR